MTESELAEALLDMLPPHACGFYLTHNEHRDYYESVEQWDELRGNGDWVSEEERAKAIAADELWEIQWYPSTPIGFFRVLGSSLTAVLAAARAESC